ncbi:AP-3 complex subunit beta [Aphelenchoides bicaudatus]|nr:AP-3 complex subunit beta [Aphelenchoides bicaudatus]
MRMSYPDGFLGAENETGEGGILENKSKFADLKTMLDNSKESIKMEAMKRIINLVARGKDTSELFPAVVKNVASKNLELKKLVYVYLVRYAEEQQDLALLSISTFQRGLKDPNQLIRASALRVLSSIRVQMISPVMLLAIKEAVRDMSAYVRKVAAHAIPKLYALDPELQPQLIECIEFLLGDKRTLVLGSAVHAFEQTCPDRIDLLHRHFRALCRALADVDEWGQVVMIGLLTRYARTQFTSPGDSDQPLDPDHSLLILSARSLLQSRNCAVVMAVAQLLYYIAPTSQLSVVPRALVRLLRGPNEVQYVVLINIATICTTKTVNDVFAISKNLFEPFLKSFFVRSSDTAHIKQLKLQILTSLVTETNVQLVIRELQAYLQMNDLVGEAVEAIGRCALQVESSADSCLSCLVNLISCQREQVVCAAVVVLKRLLHTEAPFPLLKRVVRLIDAIKAPPARACVIWLICTHIDKSQTLAPDLLRQLAKSFSDESDEVKLQTLNLAVRLWSTDRERCELLVKYVMQLARYDKSYDIRDRCRLLRNCLFKDSPFPINCFETEKPAPTFHSQFSDRGEHYQLGTLSHLLNHKCTEYTPLPDFPDVAPDPTIRRSAMPLGDEIKSKIDKQAKSISDEESFSSEESSSSAEESASDEEEESSELEESEEEENAVSNEESEKQESEESSAEESSEAESSEESEASLPKLNNKKPATKVNNHIANNNVSNHTKPTKNNKNAAPKPQNDLDLLLDLNFDSVSSGFSSNYSRSLAVSGAGEYFSLISPVSANGLTVEARYSRSPSNASLDVTASGDVFIGQLKQDERRTVTIGIDFGDSNRRAIWQVKFNEQEYQAEICAPIIDQIEAIEITPDQFNVEKNRLAGMHETRRELIKPLEDFKPYQLYTFANCKQVSGLKLCYAAQTVSRKHVVLISIVADASKWELVVNCENMAFCSMLSEALQEKLASL